MESQKVKFLKSLAWNGGMLFVAYAIDYTAKNLGLFNLSPEMVAILGVVLARCSKLLNSYIQANKELE